MDHTIYFKLSQQTYCIIIVAVQFIFVTNGGMNSLMEALYWAVPVLGIPLYGQNMRNMEKVVVPAYNVSPLQNMRCLFRSNEAVLATFWRRTRRRTGKNCWRPSGGCWATQGGDAQWANNGAIIPSRQVMRGLHGKWAERCVPGRILPLNGQRGNRKKLKFGRIWIL